MITAFYPPESFGGDAVFVQRLNRELIERGHEVDVIHCADSYYALRGRQPAAFPDGPGVTVHRLVSGLGMLAPLAAHQTGAPLLHARKIRELLIEKSFDVVHFHNISVFGPKVLETPSGGAVKLYTAHEHWLVCPLSVLWKNNRQPCAQPNCWTCMLQAKRPPQLWRSTKLLERCCRSVDAFFVMSQASMNAHKQRGFQSPMQLLPGFAPPPESAGKQSPHRRPLFFFAGRLEKYKGLQDVIPLFADEGEWDLLISGAGRYEDELRRLAAGSKRVRFLGWRRSAELGPYYLHARALIAPSLTYETFGLATAEAMSYGTPVIARNLGAFPEILAQGGGILFSDREQLAAAIQRLGSNLGLRAELGEAARRSYLRNWTPETHTSRYLEAIHSIRAAKTANRPL